MLSYIIYNIYTITYILHNHHTLSYFHIVKTYNVSIIILLHTLTLSIVYISISLYYLFVFTTIQYICYIAIVFIYYLYLLYLMRKTTYEDILKYNTSYVTYGSSVILPRKQIVAIYCLLAVSIPFIIPIWFAPVLYKYLPIRMRFDK